MICAVMQPTYFPWSGYFNLIESSDCFVFLDDVQFERSSWQQRNRLLIGGQPSYISVPTRRGGLAQTIQQVEIQEEPRWRQKQLRTIEQSYSRKPYADEMLELAGAIAELETSSLASLNIQIIQKISARLELTARFLLASELGVGGERTARLVGICDQLRCDTYLSPASAREYLEKDGDFASSDVELAFQSFEPAPYFQGEGQAFASHLSILDVIANLGLAGARAYVTGVAPPSP
jgi:hypothetical protein